MSTDDRHQRVEGACAALLTAGRPVAFVVLSGYLITSLLWVERQRTGTVSLRRFYLRRALLLLPALPIALAGGDGPGHRVRRPTG